MKITNNKQSFGAIFKRNPILGKNMSKKDMVATYDKAISSIKQRKELALELEKYMKTPEIKEIISKLPSDDVLEIYDTFSPEISLDEENNCVVNNFNYISYVPQNKRSLDIVEGMSTRKDSNYSYILEVSENLDGSLNKDSIKGWLNSIVKLFGNE